MGGVSVPVWLNKTYDSRTNKQTKSRKRCNASEQKSKGRKTDERAERKKVKQKDNKQKQNKPKYERMIETK